MAKAKVKKIDDDDERGTASATSDAEVAKQSEAKSADAKEKAKAEWVNDKFLHRIVSRLSVDADATADMSLKKAASGLPSRAGEPMAHAVRGDKESGRYVVVVTGAGQKWARRIG